MKIHDKQEQDDYKVLEAAMTAGHILLENDRAGGIIVPVFSCLGEVSGNSISDYRNYSTGAGQIF